AVRVNGAPVAGATGTDLTWVPGGHYISSSSAECQIRREGGVGNGHNRLGAGVESAPIGVKAWTAIVRIAYIACLSRRALCCVGIKDDILDRESATVVEEAAAHAVAGATLDDEVFQLHARPRVHEMEDPVLERAGVDDGRRVAVGVHLTLDDQLVRGAGDVQVTLARRIFAGPREGQGIRAGLEDDGVRRGPRVGVEGNEDGPQAAGGQAVARA